MAVKAFPGWAKADLSPVLLRFGASVLCSAFDVAADVRSGKRDNAYAPFNMIHCVQMRRPVAIAELQTSVGSGVGQAS